MAHGQSYKETVMTTRPHFSFRMPAAAFALVMLGVLTMLATVPALAQTFSVLHNFTGGADGFDPQGVTVTPSGIVYGVAEFGGSHGAGTIFKLAQLHSDWIFSPLHEFTGGDDGAYPIGGVTIGPNGALFSTTSWGGSHGFGVVFELRPSATTCGSAFCYWNETVLHSFTGGNDGAVPNYVDLVFDPAGNIYGTTFYGGVYAYGAVFELTPSGGGYTESVIHSFNFPDGGSYPEAGVVLDSAGNIYGTTTYGGTGTGCLNMDNCGTVYQLVPSGGNWTENVLVNFAIPGVNGEEPLTAPLIDVSGNLYGPAGVIYKLTPSGGGFNYSEIYTFHSFFCGDQSPLIMDAAGNFYGTCQNGPGVGGSGWIFKLTNCSQTCTVVDLHDFNGTEGSGPLGPVALDANGNLYGTTVAGGPGGNGCNNGGCGVVWELAGATDRH